MAADLTSIMAAAGIAGKGATVAEKGVSGLIDKIARTRRKNLIIISNYFGRTIHVHLIGLKHLGWIEIKNKGQCRFIFREKFMGASSCLCTVKYNGIRKHFPVYGSNAPKHEFNIYEIHRTHVLENYEKKLEWEWEPSPPTSPVSASKKIEETAEENVVYDLIDLNEESLPNLEPPQSNNELPEQRDALHSTCENGDLDMVRSLLAKGAEVDGRDQDGLTPLHCACFSGHLPVVKCLIKAGSKVNVIDKTGRTPLCYASSGSKSTIAGAFLKEIMLQLNAHSKKLFLQHAIQQLSDEDGVIASDFFKFLLPNNSFLQVSRIHHLYSFCISFDCSYYPCRFSLNKTFGDLSNFEPTEHWQTVPRTIQFLRPTRLAVQLNAVSEYTEDFMKELVEAVDGLDCRIFLGVPPDWTYTHGTFRSWASKVSLLVCDDFYSIADWPQMTLDNCVMANLAKKGLLQVMRSHKIKLLEVQDFPAEESNESNETEASEGTIDNVEGLHVTERLKDLPALIEFLSVNEVQLKELRILCSHYPDCISVASIAEIWADLDDKWSKFMSLKEKCRAVTKKLSMGTYFEYGLSVDVVADEDWLEDWLQEVRRHEVLKECEHEKNKKGNHEFTQTIEDDFMYFEFALAMRPPNSGPDSD